MTIVSAEAKPCVQRQSDAGWTFARAAVPDVRGWTIILTDDTGRVGLGYGHASADGHGAFRGHQGRARFPACRG